MGGGSEREASWKVTVEDEEDFVLDFLFVSGERVDLDIGMSEKVRWRKRMHEQGQCGWLTGWLAYLAFLYGRVGSSSPGHRSEVPL